MRSFLFVSLLVATLIVAGCGGGGEATSTTGDAAGPGAVAAGQALFDQQTIGSTAGCSTCHSLQEGTQLVGPSLAHIGTTAATRQPGTSAEAYLRSSIVQPDAHLVEGFGAGIMPKTFDQELSDQQLNDLVAFLLSLQ